MSTLFIAWLTFIVNAAAPGPSTMAIMATSLAHGRRAGLVFATGTCCGSVFWGVVAALGLGAVLHTVGWALTALKIAGGLYLLWLAWKTGRAALAADPPKPANVAAQRFWRQGVALHLTNPKAVLGWSSVIALGLPADAGAGYIVILLLGCAALAVVINLGYALAFSTAPMVRAYGRARQAIQGAFAALFASAGIGLLAWRP